MDQLIDRRGSTYTIVVENSGNIVSATRNGVLMMDLPPDVNVMGDLPKTCSNCRNINLNIPSHVNMEGCIYFGRFTRVELEDDVQCRPLWGKLV